MNIITNPTAAAIETAIRNAEKMWGDYTVSQAFGTLYTVQHNDNPLRTYAVETFGGESCPNGFCNCPQFDRTGVCKHQRFVSEWNEIAAEEAKRSDADYIAYAAAIAR